METDRAQFEKTNKKTSELKFLGLMLRINTYILEPSF